MRVDSSHRTIHPEYNSTTYANDLALLRLPFNLSCTNGISKNEISPIRIPSLSQYTQTFAGDVALVSGFGQFDDTKKISDVLRFARTQVITHNLCMRKFGRDYVTAKTICTIGQIDAQGACYNDEGGPLTVVEPTGQTLIGIVSFFDTNCNAKNPVGYVRISSYVGWLSQNANIPIRQ